MAQVSASGNDTLILQGYLFTAFADGDNIKLTFPNELVNVKPGKNGNTLFAGIAAGRLGELVLSIMRGSLDDQFLLALQHQQDQDLPTFPLLNGTFVKRIGDGTGAVTNDTYKLISGVFTKRIEASSNVDGDTKQSVVEYQFKFARVGRQIF
jgi:hypothetical protein